MQKLNGTFWREFPGGSVLGRLTFTAKGPGSIPGRGTKIPQATQQGQEKEKLNETFYK